MAVLEVLVLNAGFLFLVLAILFFFMVIKYSNGHRKVSEENKVVELKSDLNKIREQIIGQHDVV